MKPRYPLLLALLAAGCALAGSACAEWQLVGRDESVRLYVDDNSIQRKGDYAQIMQLTDFAIAQWADAQTAIGSIKALVEYDCVQPRSRAYSISAYSEQMAVGKTVANENFVDPQWTTIAPGISVEKLRQIACAK
jgi:hypothetical protein